MLADPAAADSVPRIMLTFKYRLLPSRRQHVALAQHLEGQRQLYNAALEERIGCYRSTGRGRTYVDQCRGLTEWRRVDHLAAAVPLNMYRWTLSRLDDAYRSFFKRLKAHAPRSGFPRFRSKSRWRSFGFSEFSGIRFDGKRVRFSGLPGGLRVHLHRAIPSNAEIRSCIFHCDHKGWLVCFQVAMPGVGCRQIVSSVGLDLGLKVFAYQSDGVSIPAPKVARRAEREMRRRQRALARCTRGSERRKKVKAKVTRLHAKIANTRATWLHQQAARLVRTYDLIVAENLNIRGMIRSPALGSSITDASWGAFLAMVAYKAERAGGQFITINPKNTSQQCSGCGDLVPKSLSVRTHACPTCGLVTDRDWNAARNILAAVVGGRTENVTHLG